jgi:PAS domain S-box-containing protein
MAITAAMQHGMPYNTSDAWIEPAVEAAEPPSLLAEIFDELETGICVFGRDERVLYWNAAFLKVFPEQADIIRVGLPYEDSLRRFFERNLSADQLPFLERHLAAGMERHRTQMEPYVYQKKDGRYIKCVSRPLARGGRVKLWTDVTAEHTDKVRNSPVAAAVAAMNVGFALYDCDGRFVFGNKKLDELFPDIIQIRHGASTYREHLIGLSERTLASSERPRVEALIGRTNPCQSPATQPQVFRRIDSGFVQLEERATEDGGLVSIWIDVTVRERAEAKIRESQDQLFSILESSPVGIVIGQRDGTRLFYNSRFAELHGLHLARPGENRAQASYVDPKRREQLLALVDTHGFFLDEEVELKRPDGSRWWALVSWKKIVFDGKPAHLAWNYDITPRKEAERVLAQEMSIAHHIQQSILPLRFPNDERIQVHATMQPAREIGGDFYDLFSVGENKVGIVVADVSGKGVPAAFIMAVARTVVKATGVTGLSPSACLTAVNKLLMQEDTAGLFVTAFYGVLDVESGRLVYTSAGHNMPLLMSGDEANPLPPLRGVPLGVAESWHYIEKTVQLRGGDCLLLYTDGVTDALNPAGESFGEDKLAALLAHAVSATAEDTVRNVYQAVAEHAAGTTQSDDITLMAVRYCPAASA